MRNECVYGNGKCDSNSSKMRIMKIISDSEIRLKTRMWNNQYDLQVHKYFGMKTRSVKTLKVIEVFFHLPDQGKLLLCCDGASRGNPGISGYGIIGRNYMGDFIIAISEGIGVSTNYYAEIFAILIAGEWAVNNGFRDLVFRTDSQSVQYALHTIRFLGLLLLDGRRYHLLH